MLLSLLLPWLLKLLLPSLPWLPWSSVSCGSCDYLCYHAYIGYYNYFYHQDSQYSYGYCGYPCYRGYLVYQRSLLAMVTRTRQKLFTRRIFPVLFSAFRHILNIATASSMTSLCWPLSFVCYSHCFLRMTLPTYFYTSSGKCFIYLPLALLCKWVISLFRLRRIFFFWLYWFVCRSAADRKIHQQENPLPFSTRDSALIRKSLKALGIWYQSRDDKLLIIKWLTPSFCLCRKHSSAYVIGIYCWVTWWNIHVRILGDIYGAHHYEDAEGHNENRIKYRDFPSVFRETTYFSEGCTSFPADISNCLAQNFSWNAIVLYWAKEFPACLIPESEHCFHRSLPLHSIVSQLNAAHPITPNSSDIRFKIILLFMPRSPGVTFLRAFLPKIFLYKFLQ